MALKKKRVVAHRLGHVAVHSNALLCRAGRQMGEIPPSQDGWKTV